MVIEAFDGAVVSTPWTIKVIVIYDPPVAGDVLVDQKVKVGSTLLYSTPAKNTLRQHDAIVQSPGLVNFGSTTGNTFKFEPPYTEKPGKHKIQVDYFVDDNIVTDYYWLSVINFPPYLISRPQNASYYTGSTFFYSLPMAIDPEKGPIFVKVVSELLPYVTNSGGLVFMI